MLIIERLSDLIAQTKHLPTRVIAEHIIAQQCRGSLNVQEIQGYCQRWQYSVVELAFVCLPIAACYAQAPISQFYVGAVAIGQSGNFYFGANQEFVNEAISQTIHAEQSAIAYAWLSGEQALTDIVVNYTPCGHCRQFMNELNQAAQLNIHLPHRPSYSLHHYLPDNFGPIDLNIERRLFDFQQQNFGQLSHSDPLVQAGIKAASLSYAPYSLAFSGVALQCGEEIITGRYAENAAFNPSLLPLQTALNFLHLSGLSYLPIREILLVEKVSRLSCRVMTESLAKQVCHLDIRYFAI